MKRQTTFVLTFLAVVLVFSVPSRADSDGYFCASKGYLAYELREGITPGVVGHALRVVRFGPKRGIYLASEVPLLDFEVYHFICSEDRIEISGWRNVFTKYVIEISGPGEVRSLGPTEYPGRQWNRSIPSTGTNFYATSPVKRPKKAGSGTASLNSSSLIRREQSCRVLCSTRGGL